MWAQLDSGRVQHRFEWLVAASAVALIPILVIQTDVHRHGWRLAADVANWLIWLIFLAEFALIVMVAPRRRHALRAHWFEVGVIVLTFPLFGAVVGGLRAIRVLRLGVVAGEAIEAERNSASAAAFRFVASLTLFIVVLAAAAEVLVDGREFPSLWDGIWWSVVTVTTVGYGDFYPHTVVGRIVAIALMLFGIGFLSVLTATIASRFVRADTSSDAVLAKLTQIEAELAALRQELGANGCFTRFGLRHYGVVAGNADEPKITQEMIARRAFELWLTNGSGSPEENWARAEQELREEAKRHSDE